VNVAAKLREDKGEAGGGRKRRRLCFEVVNAVATASSITNVRVLPTSSPRHNHPSPDHARPTFTVVLRPEPHVDATHAMRGALKVLLRRFGLKCISIAKEN
jgi:hypothetical protein